MAKEYDAILFSSFAHPHCLFEISVCAMQKQKPINSFFKRVDVVKCQVSTNQSSNDENVFHRSAKRKLAALNETHNLHVDEDQKSTCGCDEKVPFISFLMKSKCMLNPILGRYHR